MHFIFLVLGIWFLFNIVRALWRYATFVHPMNGRLSYHDGTPVRFDRRGNQIRE